MAQEEFDARPAIQPNPEAGKKAAKKGRTSLDDLSRTALKAFLIARDAASNVPDLFIQSSRMAFWLSKSASRNST